MSLQTREASTLVIVTFLASASLLLLTVDLDKNGLNNNFKITTPDLAFIGFMFALSGFVYRQITSWTTDRKEYNRAPDRHEKRNLRHEYYTYALIREFFLLSFLALPMVLWGEVLWASDIKLTVWHSFVIAFILSGMDGVIRMVDKWRNDPFRIHWRERDF